MTQLELIEFAANFQHLKCRRNLQVDSPFTNWELDWNEIATFLIRYYVSHVFSPFGERKKPKGNNLFYDFNSMHYSIVCMP